MSKVDLRLQCGMPCSKLEVSTVQHRTLSGAAYLHQSRLNEVDAETAVNWPTGVDVKAPVAESHLVALILRRRDRRRGYVHRRSIREFDVLRLGAGGRLSDQVNPSCLSWSAQTAGRLRTSLVTVTSTGARPSAIASMMRGER